MCVCRLCHYWHKSRCVNRRFYVRGEKEFWSEAQTGWQPLSEQHMKMHEKTNVIYWSFRLLITMCPHVYSFQHQLTGQSELFAVPLCPPLSFDLFLPPAACSVVPFSPLFHPFSVAVIYILMQGSGVGSEGSRLEAWRVTSQQLL